MPKQGYDFAGYVTRDNVRCTDGTVIRHGCFHGMNGKTVPLVWQHQHDSVGEVLGHAELEERPDGIYCYAYCNGTQAGQHAKECVRHGDINAFSIWANSLKRGARDVRDIVHGVIREVSLVYSGADKSAIIDAIAHSDQSLDDIDDAFDRGDGEAEFQFLGGYGEIVMGEDSIAHGDSTEDDNTEEDKMGGENTDEDASVQDILDTMNEDQMTVLKYLVARAAEDAAGESEDDSEEEDEDETPEEDEVEEESEEEPEEAVAHAEEEDDDEDTDEEPEPAPKKKLTPKKGRTIKDVLATLNAEQKKVLEYLVGQALKQGSGSSKDDDESEEDKEVKHNAFDEYGEYGAPVAIEDTISHDDLMELIHDAKTIGGGSLREAYNNAVANGTIAHGDNGEAGKDYGIGNVDYLFPEARAISDKPDFVSRNMDWVDGVLSAVHKTPFARVKSLHADITADEARARGYIKGKYKKEEVFSLLKRATYPQTIYKKQKMDKDDIDDITDFDIIVWMKAEMQMMLREEIARAILIGDGRDKSDESKILEDHVRPVYNDDDFYTIKFPVEISDGASDDEKAKALLKAQLKARKLYKGSGNLTFYTKEDELTNVLLLENGIGERMYKSEAEVATAMRVRTVVPVEPMEDLQISIDNGNGTSTKYDVAGIDVNLADYNVGTNGGAKTDFFSDFDLDYNAQKFLYETRLSGALVKPFSAIVFYYKTTAKTAGTTTPETEG